MFGALHSRQLTDIQHFLQAQNGETMHVNDLPSTAQFFTKLLKTNSYDIAVLFRIDETIILKDPLEEEKSG